MDDLFPMKRIYVTPWEEKQIYGKAVCIVAMVTHQPPSPTQDSFPSLCLPPPPQACLLCSQEAEAWLSCPLFWLAGPT